MRESRVLRSIFFAVSTLSVALAALPLAVPATANPIPVAICCFPDGTCQLVAEDDCIAGGGYFLPDVFECDPDPCLAACCQPDGTCEVINPGFCFEMGGTFLGYDYATCDPCNPCVLGLGACCLADGSCAVETYYDCCLAGGEVQAAPDCDPDPCAPSPLEEDSWGRIKVRYR